MGIKYLCLNMFRTFRKKKLQLFAMSSIIFLSSFLYTMTYYAMESMKIGLEKVVEATNQEAFSITVMDAIMPDEMRYVPKEKQLLYSQYTLTELKKIDYALYEGILQSRRIAFERAYPGYTLEVRSYKDILFEHSGVPHKIRIYKPAETINTTFIESGYMPQSTDEIAINRVYTEANALSIGDSIVIDDKTLRLVGHVLLSDMNFPMFDDNFIIDNTKITIGVVTPRLYEKLRGDEGFYFAGVHQTEATVEGFQEAVVDTWDDDDTLGFITSIIETKHQMRSGAIYEELKMGKVITLGLCIVIAGMAVMMVGILVAKLLKSEKVQIGVLKAIGYAPYEIALPYVWLLLLLSVPVLILGYFMGKALAEPMKTLYLSFYLLPNEPIAPDGVVILTAVCVPLAMILGLSFLIIQGLLKKPTLQLIKAGEKETMPRIGRIVGRLLRGAKPTTQFKYTFIFKNGSKFMMFFWGMMMASIMVLLSLMMSGFFDKMTVEMYESTAYAYEGILDPSKPKPRVSEQDEKYLSVGNALYEDETITLKGIEPSNQLHQLYDVQGVPITKQLEEGVIINQSFAIRYRIERGDTLAITYNDKVYQDTVCAISKDYGSETVYMTREALSLRVTKQQSKNVYNGIYSLEPLDKSMYLTTLSKEALMSQTELMQSFIQVAIGGMMSAAIFIAALILYVLTTMTVEDNCYTIAMLKVMGYSQKEVNAMLLNSYLTYAILVYCLSVPLTSGLTWVMVQYMSQVFGIILPMVLEGWHVVVGFTVIISIFFIGTFAAKRQMQKVALQEVLKAYRE